MTTIVLVEDHHLVREGLKHLLRGDATLKLAGETDNGVEAVELVERLQPDILLLDLMIPRLHGLEVIRRVSRKGKTRVIVVSMHSDEPYVIEAFRNGASGYVLKDSTPAELLQSIRVVMAGQRFISAAVSPIALSASKRAGGRAGASGRLTAREQEVLHLAAEGHTSAKIARRLFVSPRTVETHRRNLMKKLALRSQTDLVRFAIRKRIIPP